MLASIFVIQGFRAYCIERSRRARTPVKAAMKK